MDPLTHVLREELCEAQQERDSIFYADMVRDAIGAVPDFAVTPLFMSQVVLRLADKAGALREAPREIARNYLDDLFDEMKEFYQ